VGPLVLEHQGPWARSVPDRNSRCKDGDRGGSIREPDSREPRQPSLLHDRPFQAPGEAEASRSGSCVRRADANHRTAATTRGTAAVAAVAAARTTAHGSTPTCTIGSAAGDRSTTFCPNGCTAGGGASAGWSATKGRPGSTSTDGPPAERFARCPATSWPIRGCPRGLELTPASRHTSSSRLRHSTSSLTHSKGSWGT